MNQLDHTIPSLKDGNLLYCECSCCRERWDPVQHRFQDEYRNLLRHKKYHNKPDANIVLLEHGSNALVLTISKHLALVEYLP